ncbi:MAG: 4Fe-4S binding protein [Eubacteriales bacterium]|nr:4Fe-4S binding protein [Eubacteriales bacterium]
MTGFLMRACYLNSAVIKSVLVVGHVRICPQKAICAENPCQTNEERCIACGACIMACPTGTRNYHSELYEQVRVDFEKLCAEYGTPKTFYVQETVL